MADSSNSHPDFGSHANGKKSKENSIGTYIGGVVAGGILLFVINKLPQWHVPFITAAYADILWALNLSLLVQLTGNFMLLFYHPLFLHHIVQVVFNIFSIIALYFLITVFPFSLDELVGDWLHILIRIFLIIGMVATIISIIVHLVKLPAAFRVMSREPY